MCFVGVRIDIVRAPLATKTTTVPGMLPEVTGSPELLTLTPCGLRQVIEENDTVVPCPKDYHVRPLIFASALVSIVLKEMVVWPGTKKMFDDMESIQLDAILAQSFSEVQRVCFSMFVLS